MISRVWVCTEQPLVLHVLALPLHPLVLLALLLCWRVLRLAGKASGARWVGSLLSTLTAALCVLSLGFALLGWLLSVAVNPSPFLSLAPWAWALSGPLAMWIGGRRARRAAVASNERPSKRSRVFDVLLALTALFFFVVIAARHRIPDCAREASFPYRVFEWAIADELGPATDECLATRVLEYADDDQIGRDASSTLARRGRSTAPGIRARMAELRAHWPPPDRTAKKSGVYELLHRLTIYGDRATARDWEEFDWWHNFPNPKPEFELTLPR